jgi:hypothetical protein
MQQIKFGETTWTPVTKTTLEQDFKLRALLNQSIFANTELQEVSLHEQMSKLIEDSIVNGTFAKIIAMTLQKETAKKWNPEDAKELEDYINGMTDIDEKAQTQELFIDLLSGFFAVGLLRLRITPNVLNSTVQQTTLQTQIQPENKEEQSQTISEISQNSSITPVIPTLQKEQKSLKTGLLQRCLKKLFG